MTGVLVGFCIAEAFVSIGLLGLLRRARAKHREDAAAMRNALLALAHERNVLVMKETSVADLQNLLVDAGVLRNGSFNGSRR